MGQRLLLDMRSHQRLKGVHPELIAVVLRAHEITTVNFIVTEGLRSLERQKELYRKGATTTTDSRHLTGHAVDLAAKIGNEVRWDWPLYYKIADAMKQAAVEKGVSLIWGGDWKTFKDGPHFELDRKMYPAFP